MVSRINRLETEIPKRLAEAVHTDLFRSKPAKVPTYFPRCNPFEEDDVTSMQLPVEISYRGVIKSDEIDTLVRDKAAHLERFCDHIMRCDVIIEHPNKAQHSGSPFHVRIDVTVPPGHELVVNEKPGKHDMHEPLTKVINDSFKHMERQLKELTERQHHKIKTHEGAASLGRSPEQ